MAAFTVKQLLETTGGILVKGERSQRVTGVSIDTRTIRAGELYVAIAGKSLDGHQFVAEALSKDAAGIVVSETWWEQNASLVLRPSFFVIVVNNTTRALGDIAAYHRRRFDPVVIGIAGSNGKSTTKEMLAAILEQRLRVLKPASSFNNDIGVPLTVLSMDRRTQAAIVEREMNELGGIRRLCEIAQPKIGIITNVGDTHLEFLCDREGVARERSELIQYIGPNGAAVLNADDPLVRAIGRRFPTQERVLFGLEKKADIFAGAVEDLGLEGTRFRLNAKVPVWLHIPGRHNVYNALAAIAAARLMGFHSYEVVNAIEGFTGMSMRLQVERWSGMTLIIDCYNANPQSMAAALDVLAGTNGKRKIAVLGDMFELGAASVAAHRELGLRAGAVADVLVARGDYAEDVVRGAIESGLRPVSAIAFRSNRETVDKLVDIIEVGDTILVKGSRANRLEEVVQELKTHYEQRV